MADRPTPARSRAGTIRARLATWVCLVMLPATALTEQIEPPVPLRTGPFITPPEMAGTGLTPEVKLRARIDARGRVADVEILAIEPASEYDDLLRRATVETVEGWRYAPARADGEPVATTLEWTVQFKTRDAGDEPTPGGWLRLGLSPLDDVTGSRIFTLPREQQEEILRRYTGVAERTLDKARRRQVATPRFVVVSDAEEPRMAEVVAGNLEATFNVLDRIFRPRIEAQPAPYKGVVYVFARRGQFAAVSAEVGSPEWVDGLYAAPGFIAFHLEEQTAGAALSSLLHEAAHAYTERHLVRPGDEPPLWLVEGLAEYLANSEIRDGELIPGRTAKRRYALDPRAGGVLRIQTKAGWSLDEVKQAVRTGEAPGIEELVAADRALFYGEDFSLYYSLSWLFVHFLRHGEPGWVEREFPALVLYLVEGFPPADAVEATYGVAPAALNEPFRAYLKRF